MITPAVQTKITSANHYPSIPPSPFLEGYVVFCFNHLHDPLAQSNCLPAILHLIIWCYGIRLRSVVAVSSARNLSWTKCIQRRPSSDRSSWNPKAQQTEDRSPQIPDQWTMVVMSTETDCFIVQLRYHSIVSLDRLLYLQQCVSCSVGSWVGFFMWLCVFMIISR